MSKRSIPDQATEEDINGSTYGGEVIPPECIYELNDGERSTIQGIVASLPSIDLRSIDYDDFLIHIALAADELPRTIRECLRDFLEHSNDFGTLLFRRLPPDPNIPETPTDGRLFCEKRVSVSEFCLMLLMSRLGDPRGYQDEKDGAIIQPVYPIRGAEYKQENTGSREFLEIHTEDGFLPDKCDFLGLLCLRSDHERIAKTGTASGRRALSLVSGTTVEWLRKPLYRISVPSSFMSKQDTEIIWSKPIPVLSGDLLSPEMCIDLDAMEGLTTSAQKALNEFAKALRLVLTSCVLVPNDLLVIDNLVAAHARSCFRPRYDGQDRWLQRMKVVINPRSSQQNRRRGSRICGPIAFQLLNPIDEVIR